MTASLESQTGPTYRIYKSDKIQKYRIECDYAHALEGIAVDDVC